MNFGEVLRSSAIFWVKNTIQLSTVISFSNYWKFKNSNDVNVVINLRKINKIFEDESLGDEFSYLTLWCSYGGLMVFSTMEKYYSITIEHSF